MNFADLCALTPPVQAMAEKYQYPQKHCRQVATLAGQLFTQLAPLHGLPEAAATLLEHGALLHDIGNFVGHKGHQRHGAYLVKQDALLSGYPATGRTMLALLVRNHRKQAKDPADLLPGAAARATWLLCAMLNVADGLDYGHEGRVETIAAEWDERRITLTIDGLAAMPLEDVLRRKSALMRQAFGRKVRFVTPGPAQMAAQELAEATTE